MADPGVHDSDRAVHDDRSSCSRSPIGGVHDHRSKCSRWSETGIEPHQYATGMLHVFVNGKQVLKDGEHTGATPGRVVRGPGWTGR